jgi:Domain of unknown function (DUF4349)
MERSRDHDKIATALAEARPAPREAFAEDLDDLVAAGFPRRSRFRRPPLAGLADRISARSPMRLSFAAAAVALVAIAVATVVIASSDSGSGSRTIAIDSGPTPRRPHGVQGSEVAPQVAAPESGSVQYSDAIPQAAATGSSSSRAVSPPVLNSSGADSSAYSPAHGSLETESSLANLSRHREIERSAEIGLLADPTDVADDSAKVFAAVHDANGIVLRSSTSSGKNGSARFELLIPSARLGDALAAFSSIDEVRSRHEATDDITKPTVTVSEELQDTQARVDSLLAQLAGAEVESEREAIAAELRSERGHAARLRNQLARLHQRTTYSRVLVRIQSGNSTESGGAWGIGDAFHDAGHILGIAAGVTLVGLAVIAPLALLCLLAWLAQRLWLRSRRERALDA